MFVFFRNHSVQVSLLKERETLVCARNHKHCAPPERKQNTFLASLSRSLQRESLFQPADHDVEFSGLNDWLIVGANE